MLGVAIFDIFPPKMLEEAREFHPHRSLLPPLSAPLLSKNQDHDHRLRNE